MKCKTCGNPISRDSIEHALIYGCRNMYVDAGGGLRVPERALLPDHERQDEPRHGLFGCTRPNGHFGNCSKPKTNEGQR